MMLIVIDLEERATLRANDLEDVVYEKMDSTGTVPRNTSKAKADAYVIDFNCLILSINLT